MNQSRPGCTGNAPARRAGLVMRMLVTDTPCGPGDRLSIHMIHEKARERGVSRRAHTIQADLDAGWPDT